MIRNALISVSDKTNLNKLLPFLISRSANIYASSSTYKHINELLSESDTSTSNLHRVQDLTQHIEFWKDVLKLTSKNSWWNLQIARIHNICMN